MNEMSDAIKRSAISNALSSIVENERFPKKVLVGSWRDFLFFEPVMLFNPCFIDVAKLLQMEGGATVIALINLDDVVPIDYNDPPVIFIDQNTRAEEYISELESRRAPMSWRFVMDRYVCASDKGTWCIYCERQEDVAVFAFREEFSQETRVQVENLLKAKSIRLASKKGDVDSFDFGKLVPFWWSTLVDEHVPSNI